MKHHQRDERTDLILLCLGCLILYTEAEEFVNVTSELDNEKHPTIELKIELKDEKDASEFILLHVSWRFSSVVQSRKVKDRSVRK